jgi:nucleoside-diphosphate-sugar epimerase
VNPRRILVTGATGGLGMALVREALARRHRVVATGRSRAAGQQAEAIGATFVPLDLANPQSDFRRLVRGCDSVIHAAALSASWGLRREFQAVNVTATARLLEAAADAGVSRFVFVSSPSIFADFRDRIGIGETAAPASQPLNHYAATKLAAERLVLARREDAMACCAIRPRALVGPGDRVILPRLAELAARKRMPLPRGGRALIELTDLRDAAWAICEAEQRAPDLASRAINISGGKPVQVREVALEVARTLGRHPRLVSLPAGLARGVGSLCERIARLRRSASEPVLTRYTAATLAYSQTFDLEPARHLLGYEPKHDALATLLAEARHRSGRGLTS